MLTLWIKFVQLVVVVVLLSQQGSSQADCHLETKWSGKWLDSESDDITITGDTISTKGRCVEQSGSRYLFLQQSDARKTVQCWRCMIFFYRNPNVLQYKEGGCQTDTKYCKANSIPGDAVLHTLFRAEAGPQPCPFGLRDPFHFVYSVNRGKPCGHPKFRGSVCLEEHFLQLSYRSCPPLESGKQKDIKTVVKCLGNWSVRDRHYFSGQLQSESSSETAESPIYRCFVYTESDDDGSFIIGQSADRSCKGLDEPSHIPILYNAQLDERRSCAFATWLQSTDSGASPDWTSLSGRWHHRFSGTNWIRKDFQQETVLSCEQNTEDLEQMQRYIVSQKTNCSTTYQCLTVHKRSENVVQLEFTDATEDQIFCDSHVPNHHVYANVETIIGSDQQDSNEICPFPGRYHIGGCANDTQLSFSIGCDQPEILSFTDPCTPHLQGEYKCVGHWQSAQLHFVPLRQLNSSLTICFVFGMNGDSIVEFYVNVDSCQYDPNMDKLVVGRKSEEFSFQYGCDGPMTLPVATTSARRLQLNSSWPATSSASKRDGNHLVGILIGAICLWLWI